VPTLGIDLAVRAAHVATLTDDSGKVVWTRRRFHSLWVPRMPSDGFTQQVCTHG
jgi:hypothetical protein